MSLHVHLFRHTQMAALAYPYVMIITIANKTTVISGEINERRLLESVIGTSRI